MPLATTRTPEGWQPACPAPASAPPTGRAPTRLPVRLLALAAALLAAPVPLHAQAAAAAPDAPEIRWPTPSQPPGTITYRSKHPTESAWDPALAQFAQGCGDAFQAMADAARRYADSAAAAPKADLSPTTGEGIAPPSAVPLLRVVDIVRLPVLPVEEMAAPVARARAQLEALRRGGFGRAVWEVTDLPADDLLAGWADACLAVFAQPPILMLGWHLDNGHIVPAHDRALRFLETYAPRCHSVMITGEEFNTQFYAAADGGKALPFLRYWIGALRSRAPGGFLWCRIDEMVTSQRPNARQEAWTRELLPLCDGLAYQVNHGAPDVRDRRRVSEQFQAVERVVADLRRTGAHPPRRARDSSWPVLLGGFVVVRAAPPGLPAFGLAGMAAELQSYESWLGKENIAGYIRYVGMLPAEPVAELVAFSLPGPVAPAKGEKGKDAGVQTAPAKADGGPGTAPADQGKPPQP